MKQQLFPNKTRTLSVVSLSVFLFNRVSDAAVYRLRIVLRSQSRDGTEIFSPHSTRDGTDTSSSNTIIEGLDVYYSCMELTFRSCLLSIGYYVTQLL